MATGPDPDQRFADCVRDVRLAGVQPRSPPAGAILNFLTGNWGAAAADVAGHALMSFLATPIFFGLSHLLIPGLIIAYVLPMIPWVMWMAGVCGWIILVCEAMIAVPLWMLAHMTVGGDGLHGRAIEGWGLLVQRRLPAQPDGDRPVPRLLRLRLHVLADPRKLRHRRRLRAQQRLARQQLHRRRRAARTSS